MNFLQQFKMVLPEPTQAALRGALVVAGVAICMAVFLAWRSLPAGEDLAPTDGLVDALATHSPTTELLFADELGNRSADPVSFQSLSQATVDSTEIFVHVLGSVMSPGVFELPAGSRAVVALEAAGGLRPGAGLGGVNLARLLTDGEQIYFGPKAKLIQKSVVDAGSKVKSPPNDLLLINLNTATAVDLESLPGIGPALASRIIDFRTKHGGFGAVVELSEVAGIGPKRLEEIAPLVTV
jgi:competence protein ComEA